MQIKEVTLNVQINPTLSSNYKYWPWKRNANMTTEIEFFALFSIKSKMVDKSMSLYTLLFGNYINFLFKNIGMGVNFIVRFSTHTNLQVEFKRKEYLCFNGHGIISLCQAPITNFLSLFLYLLDNLPNFPSEFHIFGTDTSTICLVK